MKKLSIATIALCLVMAPAALAADYTFQNGDSTDYYRSTSYEIINGSAYNYGGMNITDVTDYTALLPGIVSPSAQQASYSAASTAVSGYGSAATENALSSYTVSAAYTPISQLLRKDGSIGTVTIDSRGIVMKVYEGTTDQSMDKGLGHFSDSSGWDGNVALSGVRPDRTLLKVV